MDVVGRPTGARWRKAVKASLSPLTRNTAELHKELVQG